MLSTPSPFFFNTSILFERKDPTRDRSGGQVENFSEITSIGEVVASIQALSGDDQLQQAQRQVIFTHNIYVLVDAITLLQRGDRILEPRTSRKFLIHGIVDMGGRYRVWKLESREVT